MTRRQKPNLNLVGITEELKKRLRIEAIKQETSPSKLAFTILDAALPKLEESNDNGNNSQGNGHLETLREQFEKASQS